MHETAERIVEAVQQGKLGRREAVGRLVALAAATFVPGATLASSDAKPESTPAPSFKSVGLNHIALGVSDVARSRDFYRRHLGLETLRESLPDQCFLAAGGNNFVALFRSSNPGMDHYCYTIEEYDHRKVGDKLEALGLPPKRISNRVYFNDPDGIEVQLASEWGDYPAPRR